MSGTRPPRKSFFAGNERSDEDQIKQLADEIEDLKAKEEAGRTLPTSGDARKSQRSFRRLSFLAPAEPVKSVQEQLTAKSRELAGLVWKVIAEHPEKYVTEVYPTRQFMQAFQELTNRQASSVYKELAGPDPSTELMKLTEATEETVALSSRAETTRIAFEQKAESYFRDMSRRTDLHFSPVSWSREEMGMHNDLVKLQDAAILLSNALEQLHASQLYLQQIGKPTLSYSQLLADPIQLDNIYKARQGLDFLLARSYKRNKDTGYTEPNPNLLARGGLTIEDLERLNKILPSIDRLQQTIEAKRRPTRGFDA